MAHERLRYCAGKACDCHAKAPLGFGVVSEGSSLCRSETEHKRQGGGTPLIKAHSMAQVVTTSEEGKILVFRKRVPRGTEKRVGTRPGELAACRSLSTQRLPALLIFFKYKEPFQDVRLSQTLPGPGGRWRSCRY